MSSSPAVVQVSADKPEHRYSSEEMGKNGAPRRVALKHMSIPEMRRDFCIPDFLEVSYHDGGDVLTTDMIREFPYSSTKLLIAAGQLEAGLRLPLYDAENPFQYEALANRSPQRGVVQFTGNFYRMMRECVLRSEGKTTLPSGSNAASFDTNDYTPENFNITYLEVKRKMLFNWCVGPHRNPTKTDKRARLLNDVDNVKISKFLRWDHDDRWYSTPLVISGPWVLGQMPDGSARTCNDKEYPAYSPWELNLMLLPYMTVSSSSKKKKRKLVKLIGKKNNEKGSGEHEIKRSRVENVNKNINKHKRRVKVLMGDSVMMSEKVLDWHNTRSTVKGAGSYKIGNDLLLQHMQRSNRLATLVDGNDDLLLKVAEKTIDDLNEDNTSLKAKHYREANALKKQLDGMRRIAEKVSPHQQECAAAQTDRTILKKLDVANAEIESRKHQIHSMESDLNKAEAVIQKKDGEIDVLRNKIQGLLPLEQDLKNAALEREKLCLLVDKRKEEYMKNVETHKLTITKLKMELAEAENSYLELDAVLQDSEQARSRAETQVDELRTGLQDSEQARRRAESQVAELREELEDFKRKLHENLEVRIINRSFPRRS